MCSSSWKLVRTDRIRHLAPRRHWLRRPTGVHLVAPAADGVAPTPLIQLQGSASRPRPRELQGSPPGQERRPIGLRCWIRVVYGALRNLARVHGIVILSSSCYITS
jgi:hypothetical protein